MIYLFNRNVHETNFCKLPVERKFHVFIFVNGLIIYISYIANVYTVQVTIYYKYIYIVEMLAKYVNVR